MKLNVFFSILGLSLDIIGAFFLARSVFTKSTWDIYAELKMPNDYTLAYNMFQQKAEAKAGFILLMLGFAFQIFTYFVPQRDITKTYFVLIPIVMLIFYLLINLSIQKFTKNHIAKLIETSIRLEGLKSG